MKLQVKPPPAQKQIFLAADKTLKEVPLRPGFLFTDLGEVIYFFGECLNYIYLQMTGKFSCEFERTVSVLSHIVETIEHCISLKDADVERVFNMTAVTMTQFRRFIWGCVLESSSKGEFEWKCSYIFQHSVFMSRVMSEMEKLAIDPALVEAPEDELKWFTTFVIILNFLFIEDYAIHCRLKGRPEPHSEVRHQVLDSMANNLLPYKSLVALICQGDTSKECSLCHEPMEVTAYFPSYLGFMDAPEGEQQKPLPNHLLKWAEAKVVGQAFVYLDIYGFTLYCCTSQKCLKKVFVLIRVTRAKHNEEFARSENYANQSHCAYCFKQCAGRPRCGGCKSKVYCSKECQEQDWEVHELFCEALNKEKRRYRSKRQIDENIQERLETQDNLVKNCSKVTETFEEIYDGLCNDENASVAEIGKLVVDKLVLDTEMGKLTQDGEKEQLAINAEVD